MNKFECVECHLSFPIGSEQWICYEGIYRMCKQCCERADEKYAQEKQRKAKRRIAVRLIRRGTILKQKDLPKELIELKIVQLNLKKLICQHRKTSNS
jgi:hypothetical protein